MMNIQVRSLPFFQGKTFIVRMFFRFLSIDWLIDWLIEFSLV